jgi:environmental stress-induced protein Ves
MNVRHLAAHALAPVPWKNGRGTTREIARVPGYGPFDWRLSLADLTESGPFSSFPGVTRSLLLVDGGLELHWPDRVVRLAAPGQSVTFDGGQPPYGYVRTPGHDLNLMTRHGLAVPTPRLWATGTGLAPLPAAARGDVGIFFVLDGRLDLSGTSPITARSTLIWRGSLPALKGRAVGVLLHLPDGEGLF